MNYKKSIITPLCALSLLVSSSAHAINFAGLQSSISSRISNFKVPAWVYSTQGKIGLGIASIALLGTACWWFGKGDKKANGTDSGPTDTKPTEVPAPKTTPLGQKEFMHNGIRYTITKVSKTDEQFDGRPVYQADLKTNNNSETALSSFKFYRDDSNAVYAKFDAKNNLWQKLETIRYPLSHLINSAVICQDTRNTGGAASSSTENHSLTHDSGNSHLINMLMTNGTTVIPNSMLRAFGTTVIPNSQLQWPKNRNMLRAFTRSNSLPLFKETQSLQRTQPLRKPSCTASIKEIKDDGDKASSNSQNLQDYKFEYAIGIEFTNRGKFQATRVERTDEYGAYLLYAQKEHQGWFSTTLEAEALIMKCCVNSNKITYQNIVDGELSENNKELTSNSNLAKALMKAHKELSQTIVKK